MRIITIFVYLMLAIGFIADIAFVSPRYASRFTMVGFLLTLAIAFVRREKYPRIPPLSTTGKSAVYTMLLVTAICFLVPLIMNVKLGIPMRETGIIFENPPFEVKYGDDIKEVNSKIFFVNSIFMIILFDVMAFGFCFVIWHETKIEIERKKKRDAKYRERKKGKKEV